MRIVALLLVLVFVSYGGAYAQAIYRSTDTSDNTSRAGVIHKRKGLKPMKHEASLGFRLNTNGWGIFTEIGKAKPKDYRHADIFYNVSFLHLEFSEVKDPKEEKTTSGYSNSMGGSNAYVYGKINNFYTFKVGYGSRRMIAGKPDPGTVSIHWVNAGGLSLGLLKPYYLDLYTDQQAVKYTTANANDFLNQSLIVGSAGFSKGLGEIKFIPGAYLRSALHFDFSASRKTVFAFEVGAEAAYYSQQVAIMANQSAQSFFADLFISVQFGKRW